jgi:hypothetical protein
MAVNHLPRWTPLYCNEEVCCWDYGWPVNYDETPPGWNFKLYLPQTAGNFEEFIVLNAEEIRRQIRDIRNGTRENLVGREGTYSYAIPTKNQLRFYATNHRVFFEPEIFKFIVGWDGCNKFLNAITGRGETFEQMKRKSGHAFDVESAKDIKRTGKPLVEVFIDQLKTIHIDFLNDDQGFILVLGLKEGVPKCIRFLLTEEAANCVNCIGKHLGYGDGCFKVLRG